MTDVNKKNVGTLKIIAEIAIVVFALGIAWATIRERVGMNSDNIERNQTQITKFQERTAEMQGDIREIRMEQGYISAGIKDIKEKLK